MSISVKKYIAYVASEAQESKLNKAVGTANRLIAKVKADIASLKEELSKYKSIRSKLYASNLKRENAKLLEKF